MEDIVKSGIIVVAISSIVAFSVLFAATHYRRRRRSIRRSSSSSSSSCYLHLELKPQTVSFHRVLVDNSYTPFKHINNLTPSSRADMSKLHPYETQITSLLEEPRLEFDFVKDDIDLKMSDSYVWVETESTLQELVQVLSKERIFAVDTEQHSLRSFLGFTALIQISTQEEDYLVDTITLHDQMGILRPVFADPKILKIFHGADNDVLWLQKDFHIYVVNLFDTAKSCDVLSKPQKSLAYLLETYCRVATNKTLQREDWRQRPLPQEMVQYARIDAHYLLYIAKCLIDELKQQNHDNSSCLDDTFNFLLEASRRSNMTCLQLYTKEIEEYPGESAASSIFNRHLTSQRGVPSKTSDSQFHGLVRQLCAWRDLMARIHDENIRYVLSDQAIVALAENAPETQTEIYSTISEADVLVDSVGSSAIIQSPSPVVCSHVEDLCSFFQDKTWNPGDIFEKILRKHLGPNGTCPLSILNYSILSKTEMKQVNKLGPNQNGGRKSKQVTRKASRELFVQKFSCKSPVYHNCRIYANDGRLLCYCDRRKLEWYVRRDLAKLVDDNPPAIMLLFEPKGRPEDEDNDFYVQTKKNICVGCGEKNHYLRYRIIPSCYRVHFPEHMKSHRSHDIVLVCVDCHEVAHAAAERYKKHIAVELGIPLFVQKVVDSRQVEAAFVSSETSGNLEAAGVSPLQLRTAAMALVRHGPRMPANRREELIQILMKYYGRREISADDLEKALLVGMSTHEKRRLEKKKGLSFEQHSGESKLRVKETNNNAVNINGSAIADTSQMVSEEILEGSREEKAFDEEDFMVNNDESENQSIPNGTTTGEFSYSTADGNVSQKHNSKLSLLGHGPHGKQVVDQLLKEHGEDGIRQFCQKWREVFVESVHPRFLAPGWDVMHSGKRDFGDFSVYSPGKKVSADAQK